MLDWNGLRFFLAIARHGSLSAAAKELRVVPSTVGRRLASLEAGLAVRLLNRTPDGYVPTLASQSVRAQAERLEAEALSLERIRAVLTHVTEAVRSRADELLPSEGRSGGRAANEGTRRAGVAER